MKGYYERSSYVGFIPDGTKQRFPTWKEYVEAYLETLKTMGK